MISVRHHNAREATPTNAAAVTASGFKQIITQRVYTVFCSNQSGSVVWLQLFDSATTPAEGTVPFIEVVMAANGQASVVYPMGRVLADGLYVCGSSTQGVKTLTGEDLIIDVTHD